MKSDSLEISQELFGNIVNLNAQGVLWLSVLATIGLILMWSVFWYSVSKSGENIFEIIQSPATFKIITVMGVIAATAVLSLAGRLKGEITGAILSGIVGYVLGQITSKIEGENNPKT